MSITEAAPNRLAEWRKVRGLSQVQLGEMIGWSGQHVGHLESGRTALDEDWRNKIAEVLEIDPAQLLSPDDPKLNSLSSNPVEILTPAVNQEKLSAAIAASLSLARVGRYTQEEVVRNAVGFYFDLLKRA